MKLPQYLRRARDVALKAPKGRRVTRVSIEREWTIVGSTDLEIWYEAEVRWPYAPRSDREFVADAVALAKYKGSLSDFINRDPFATQYTPAPLDALTHSMTVSLPALARVRHAMGRDPSRPTRGVWVESGHLVATDGHRLAVSDVDPVACNSFKPAREPVWISDASVFEPARLSIRLVDLACKMFEGRGLIAVERGERTIRIRCEHESLTARIDLDRYPPWRLVFPEKIEALCQANREALANAAICVGNTTDDGRVCLRIGSPLLAFDRGPDHDVEYRIKSSGVEYPDLKPGWALTAASQTPIFEITVSGAYVADALEGLICKDVEVHLGQDIELEKAEAEYEEIKRSDRLFIPEMYESKIKALRDRDPIIVELRAEGWRALIMAIRT